MKTYICYYSCPCCPDPCCFDPEEESNEMLEAENKAEARKYFNNCKQCRWMKLTRIVEDKPGISDITATVGDKSMEFKSLGAAIDWAVKEAAKTL